MKREEERGGRDWGEMRQKQADRQKNKQVGRDRESTEEH